MRGAMFKTASFVCGGILLLSALSSSAQDLRSGVEQLAEQIIRAASGEKKPRVAFVDFLDLLGMTSNLGRYIANRLTTRFAQSGFFVVERQRLGQVLEELKFNMSDLVDPEKAKQIGKIVGVEAIVVGTVSDLGHQVDIDARVIEIETSRMLASATATISKDHVVLQLMAQGVGTTPTFPLRGTESARTAQSSSVGTSGRTDAWLTAFIQANESAVTRGELESLMNLWSEDAELVTPHSKGQPIGKSAIREDNRRERAAYTEVRFVEKRRIIHDNIGMFEGIWEGLDRKLNQRVRLPVVMVLEFNEKGQVRRARYYFDLDERQTQ